MNRALSGLASVLVALAFFVPFAASADNNGGGNSAKAAGAVTLPITGAVTGGGTFNGTVTINRFAVQNGALVATGLVRGAITSAAGVVMQTGLRTVTFPVSLASLPTVTAAAPAMGTKFMPAVYTGATGGLWMKVQATTSCGVLHLELGAVATNLLGATVNLSPVTLDLSGDSAGPLGGLVCQAIGLLNNVVGVVGTLNSILGSLTGLLGGVTGGLGA
ncbi:MAG TPA: hypothetical protein VFJ62_00365 [Usitatibacter sp.]|nr:hypothetical protein [Usitatibacter sp.]